MKNKTLSENLSELNDVLKSYLAARVKLWKILLLEKITKAETHLFTTLVVMISAFSCLLFLGFAFSFWYGETVGSYATGFLISAGFSLLLMALIYLLRKRIFARNILKHNKDLLFNEDEKDNP
jgi:apolipoprotein N-acyltransferase